MFCTNCRKEISNIFKFCPYCGTNIATFLGSSSDSNQSYFDIRDGVLVKYSGRASDVVIPNTVRKIGAYAFVEKESNRAYSSNSYIKRITMSDSVTEIEAHSFYYMPELVSVRLSNNITILPSFSFYSEPSYKLRHIELPSRLVYIEACCFEHNRYSDCYYKHLHITLPASVKKIGTSIDCLNDSHNFFHIYGGLKYSQITFNSALAQKASRLESNNCIYCGGKLSTPFFSSTPKCSRCGREAKYSTNCRPLVDWVLSDQCK